MIPPVQNPIIFADVPDPDVIRVGDVYYMTSTTMYFNPGCPIMKSTDLIHWEIIGYVYDILEDMDAMNLHDGKHDYGKGSWASCLRYHQGLFYVIFAAYSSQRTYVYTTTNIESGTWSKHVIEGIYHDMSMLFDDDGRVYMVYGGGVIKVVEMTSCGTAIKKQGMNKVIIGNADITGRDGLAEGAHIYKINGFYYIFIICWPKTGKKRRIQVCYRSDKIDGMYEGKIILDDDLGFHNAGVAQGGIVDSACGQWYGLLFQDHGAVGRIPVLVPVLWVDGWPMMGEDGLVPSAFALPAPEDARAPIYTSDDFDSTSLKRQWQWNHNPLNSHWNTTSRPGWLRLITGIVCKSLTDARNTLTQRTFGPVCSGSIKIDVRNMLSGDFAGLAVLQDQYGTVAVKMDNGQKYFIMTKAVDQTKEPNAQGKQLYKTGIKDDEIACLTLDADVVYLKIDCDFTDGIDEARFYYRFDEQQWMPIGDVLKMSYRLSHFTGYRFALFNYATEQAGGFVDVDWFRLN